MANQQIEAGVRVEEIRRAFELPTYQFKGRLYKTVSGLSKAIFQDSGCDSHSMVVDRVITATVGRKPDQRVVARYTVSAPCVGKPMTVTRQKEVQA